MKKEDIEITAKLLTNMKDSLDELEDALKKGSSDRVASAKRKILELQVQIGRKI